MPRSEAPAVERDRAVAAVGLLLLAGYLVQAWFEPATWIVELQRDDRYRVPSGMLLAAYVICQARLGARRVREPARAVARHQLLGALAPAVLYLHAAQIAYGYLLVLAFVYLGVMILGLAHRPIVAARARTLFVWWFVIHTSLATFLVVFGAYHAVVALAYE